MLESLVYHMGDWIISVDNVGWSVRVYWREYGKKSGVSQNL